MPDTRINTIKIKDLPESSTLQDSDIVLKDDSIVTQKFNLSTLIQFIKNHTEISKFFVHQSTINAVNGIAPLDSNKKVPSDNINYGKTAGTVYRGSDGTVLETIIDNHIVDEISHLTIDEHTDVTEAITKSHLHLNGTVLDKLTEVDGILNFDGQEMGGGGSGYLHPNPTRTDTNTSNNVLSGGSIVCIDSITSTVEGHLTEINLQTVTLPPIYDKATSDACGNEIINQKTSQTEPITQKVGDYWVSEY